MRRIDTNTTMDPSCLTARGIHDCLESDTRGEGMGILGHVTSRASPEYDLRGRPPEVDFLHGSEGVDQRPLQGLPTHPQAAPGRGRAYSAWSAHVTQPDRHANGAQGRVSTSRSTLSTNTNTINDCNIDSDEQHQPSSSSY